MAGAEGALECTFPQLGLVNTKVTRRLERPWGSFCATKLPEPPVISSGFCFDSFGELTTNRAWWVLEAKRAKQLLSSGLAQSVGGCGGLLAMGVPRSHHGTRDLLTECDSAWVTVAHE